MEGSWGWGEHSGVQRLGCIKGSHKMGLGQAMALECQAAVGLLAVPG